MEAVGIGEHDEEESGCDWEKGYPRWKRSIKDLAWDYRPFKYYMQVDRYDGYANLMNINWAFINNSASQWIQIPRSIWQLRAESSPEVLPTLFSPNPRLPQEQVPGNQLQAHRSGHSCRNHQKSQERQFQHLQADQCHGHQHRRPNANQERGCQYGQSLPRVPGVSPQPQWELREQFQKGLWRIQHQM